MTRPLPTKAEIFTHLLEQLRLAEEAAYILGHYHKEQDDWERGQGFLGVGEMFHMTIVNVTNIATKALRLEGGLR